MTGEKKDKHPGEREILAELPRFRHIFLRAILLHRINSHERTKFDSNFFMKVVRTVTSGKMVMQFSAFSATVLELSSLPMLAQAGTSRVEIMNCNTSTASCLRYSSSPLTVRLPIGSRSEEVPISPYGKESAARVIREAPVTKRSDSVESIEVTARQVIRPSEIPHPWTTLPVEILLVVEQICWGFGHRFRQAWRRLHTWFRLLSELDSLTTNRSVHCLGSNFPSS